MRRDWSPRALEAPSELEPRPGLNLGATTDRLLIENPSYRAWWSLARAYHSLAAVLSRFFEEQGITGAQYGVLRCVADAGPEGLMLSDLSKRLMVTCGNITGVVDRLEQAGYLRRERCPEDRRVVFAQLTPAGAALFDRVLPLHLELISELTASLPLDECAALADRCEALHEAVETRRQEGR
jgi:MarR family 2-MHQ and catechol resistance regulon transcriptional repressor